MEEVVIIGAGASGLACGIELGRRGISCLILEGKEKAGKKIYASGNGKCNLANRNISADKYHSMGVSGYEQIRSIVPETAAASVEQFFHEIGIPFTERNGYLYPHSEQAGAVVHAMEETVTGLGGHIKCNTYVTSVEWNKKRNCFQIHTNEERYQCKRLVLAAGGAASPQHGSDGSGYKLAGQLGHSVTPCLPSLCGLKVQASDFQKLQGIRAKGQASLFIDNRRITVEHGEIQFTQYGLSGIAVFNLSRYAGVALHKRKQVRIDLDLCVELSEQELWTLFKQAKQISGYRNIGSVLSGIIPEKLARYLLKHQGISEEIEIRHLKPEDIKRLIQMVKRFSADITDTNTLEQAQVTAGGIPLSEIDLDTMESKLCPSCYLTGELVDVDGCCGGYNLMWAWESGRRAGQSINDTN